MHGSKKAYMEPERGEEVDGFSGVVKKE